MKISLEYQMQILDPVETYKKWSSWRTQNNKVKSHLKSKFDSFQIQIQVHTGNFISFSSDWTDCFQKISR